MDGRARMAIALAATTLAATLPLGGASTSADEVPFLVGFYDLPSIAAGDRYHGARVDRVDAPLRFARVLVDDAEAFVERLRADVDVRYVEPDGELRALFTPDDPYLASGLQYAPSRIQGPAAWDQARGSTAVQVCVIDSGVLRAHEDIGSERYLGGIDLVDDDAEPDDGNGHGTFVTALAVARTDNGKGIAGIAAASWRHARVLGDGGTGSLSDGASAIRWCADQGAFVVTASLGTDTPSTTLRDAVDYAWDAGSLLVAASGNDGCIPCVDYPAAFDRAIAVGCTTSADAVCSLSSGGPEIDVTAPGQAILSAYRDGGYAQATGTSAAAPHVAGALALLKSYGPHITNAQARAKLEATAKDLGGPGFDEAYGHGLLQMRALLTNTAPRIALACAPTVAVDASHTCAVTVEDDEGHEANVTLAYSDGTTSVFSMLHGATAVKEARFGAEGPVTVTATAQDVAGDALSATPVQVQLLVLANAPPAVPSLACAPTTTVPGAPVTCTFWAEDDSDAVRFEVEWGDGASAAVPPVVPGEPATATHAYASPGAREVRVRAMDDASAPLASPWALAPVDVRDCAFRAEGRLLLGGAGLRVDGVTSATVSIPRACASLPYRLATEGAATEIDVCWYAEGELLGCDAGSGPEQGAVPEGADEAVVLLFVGVDARYALRIPG